EVERDLSGMWITLVALVILMLAAAIVSAIQGAEWIAGTLVLACFGVGAVAFIQRIKADQLLRSHTDDGHQWTGLGWLKLICGFLAGTAISAAVWVLGWNNFSSATGGMWTVLPWLVPVGKIVAGMILVFGPGLREVGAGRVMSV